MCCSSFIFFGGASKQVSAVGIMEVDAGDGIESGFSALCLAHFLHPPVYCIEALPYLAYLGTRKGLIYHHLGAFPTNRLDS